MDRRDFLKQSVRAATSLAIVSPLDLIDRVRAPIRRTAAPQKILVAGAGLAGMCAAYELLAAGHDVTILEARARCGGRVLTLREPFADGLYAEAGAMQVFDVHRRAMKYLKLFELDIDPISPPPRASLMQLFGKRIRITPRQPISWPFDLHPDERELLPRGLWDKYCGAEVTEVAEAESRGSMDRWPDSLLAYDRMTMTEFWRKKGASPAAIGILRLGLASGLGDGADHVSALNLLRESVHRQQVRQSFTIRGGSDRFPKAFAARLAERIRYGTPVNRIEHDAAGVKVHCADGRMFAGDRLICTLPFSMLRRIQVSPAFSHDKQVAVEQLQYTSVARVFVQTRTRFWIDEGLSGVASTDLPMMNTSERTINQAGTRGILESYMAGAPARRAASLGERERFDAIVRDMTAIFPAMREQAEGGASKCWDEDEWNRGAYAWFKPGQMASILPHIARAEGRIHFAGEHTSSQPGWMEGALESAERVIGEVMSAEKS